jgi:hypothetical protein
MLQMIFFSVIHKYNIPPLNAQTQGLRNQLVSVFTERITDRNVLDAIKNPKTLFFLNSAGMPIRQGFSMETNYFATYTVAFQSQLLELKDHKV